MSTHRKYKERLKKHENRLENHFQKASEFLVKCQIIDPYVKEGILQGSVCPWEIGVADTYGFTILEDFHDTLEAIWVWCYYTKISGNASFKANIDMGWNYITANINRHIPPNKEDEGLYNCSQLILCGTLYKEIFLDDSYDRWMKFCGDRLTHYFLKSGTSQKEHEDFWIECCWAWWMASCLGNAGQFLSRNKWIETARDFVRRTITEERQSFSDLEKESSHRGPGGHDCFSCNANKILALLSCHPSKKVAKEMIIKRFLPIAPKRFVKRDVDENPWNANVAMALGKSYLLTGEEKFLTGYFSLIDELKRRDHSNSSALPRSNGFPVKESWVAFFYAYAYASIVA